jgi:hypothetical protein
MCVIKPAFNVTEGFLNALIFLCNLICLQAALAFSALSSMMGLGSQRVSSEQEDNSLEIKRWAR